MGRARGRAAGPQARCPWHQPQAPPAALTAPRCSRWDCMNRRVNWCSSLLQQGRSRVAGPVKAKLLDSTQIRGRQAQGLSCCLPGGRRLFLLSPAEHLTSQSLHTSSKDLKARWKQRQNQGKRDCTVPAPFPSVGREVGCQSRGHDQRTLDDTHNRARPDRPNGAQKRTGKI